jgi:hypothetical protein
MEHNVGNIDRGIRFIIGFGLFLVGMYLKVLLITAVGLLVILTGIIRFCLLYKILKISTVCKGSCEKETPEH